jgi:hypothetical protein
MKTSRDVNETILCILLRYMGFVTMLALVAVFMPYSWMNATHRWLGLGDLPAAPIVGYLARSLSLFYALLGGLLWFLSSSPRRHRAVLLSLGAAFVSFGVICFGIDFVEDLPNFWKWVEGPFVILYGAALLLLALRLNTTS